MSFLNFCFEVQKSFFIVLKSLLIFCPNFFDKFLTKSKNFIGLNLNKITKEKIKNAVKIRKIPNFQR
jgi:hypothetical protein